MVRIILERDAIGNGELVVVHARGFGDQPGLSGGAHSYVLVGEAALEGVEQVTARLGEGIQSLDLRVRRRVKRGNNDELVRGRSVVEGSTKSTSAFIR